jgi:hypothetical protein
LGAESGIINPADWGAALILWAMCHERRQRAPIPFAGSRFDQTRHVCAFFSNDDDEYWTVKDQSRVDDVIEFEARVNDVWRRHEDAVICTYHLGQFRGNEVIDIMRTHPMVIIGGLLQQNPFLFRRTNF